MKVYRHICDGSAGLAVDETRFLVANDETEIIHLFRNDTKPAEPIAGTKSLSSAKFVRLHFPVPAATH